MRTHSITNRRRMTVGAICCALLLTQSTVAFVAERTDVLRNDMWGIRLELPGYTPWTDHPLHGKPNLVFAATARAGSCPLNLSMFAINVPEGATAHQCRKGFMGNPEFLSKQREVTLLHHQIDPVTYTLYDLEVGSADSPMGTLRQNQLYGYWSHQDLCFELHISSINCGEFRTHALPILETVTIDEASGATIETVALAQAAGRRPGDWRVHLAAASKYLHDVEPSVPGRARRFYRSALALGDNIDDRSRWIIQEGLGLSWLMEDRGQEAIPFLTDALEIARRFPEGETMLASTLYNISCAYSLAEDVDSSCHHLQELVSMKSGSELKGTLKEIKKDKQLRRVRKSPCYKDIRASAG